LDNFEWPYLRNGSRSTYIARILRGPRGHLCDSTALLLLSAITISDAVKIIVVCNRLCYTVDKTSGVSRDQSLL